MIESLKEKFTTLKMKSCADNIEEVVTVAGKANLTILETIEQLIDFEMDVRKKNRIDRLFKASKLIEKQTIDQFEFNFDTSRKKQKTLILNLMDLGFINQKKDIIIIGNSGVGKSFLAKCIAYAATQVGIKTLFTRTVEMINQLKTAEVDNSLLKELQNYQSPDLLVCDELGYLPLGQQGSELLFQIITARHEQKSTIITTNLPFADWGKIFERTSVATAVADRLVYNSEILILEGESYRKRNMK